MAMVEFIFCQQKKINKISYAHDEGRTNIYGLFCQGGNALFQMPMMGGRICIHGLFRLKEISKVSNAHDWWSVTPRAAEAEAWLHVGFNLDLDGLRLTWVINEIQNIL